MKNRFYILLMLLLTAVCATAQQEGVAVADPRSAALARTQESLLAFNTEHLDSLDQELLPRKVTLGLVGAPNTSHFIITREGSAPLSSNMKIGADVGGFIDFVVTPHFAIQGQVVFTAEQNRFHVGGSKDRLWSFGANVPVYFLGRFGNREQGYVSFGAGPFTHVTFASNISGHYSNNGADPTQQLKAAPAAPASDAEENGEYDELYKLHRFHSGLAATAIYEFPVGVQIYASYMVSLTDIFSFYSAHEGQPVANASIYPQRVSLGVGYRFRYRKELQRKPREGRDHM